jgi:hypothetical protein
MNAKEDIVVILKMFDYNTFLDFVIRGEVRGKDLLALSNSCKKFNDYCNRSFEFRDKDSNVIEVR